jgi:hypothetical protein
MRLFLVLLFLVAIDVVRAEEPKGLIRDSVVIPTGLRRVTWDSSDPDFIKKVRTLIVFSPASLMSWFAADNWKRTRNFGGVRSSQQIMEGHGLVSYKSEQ